MKATCRICRRHRTVVADRPVCRACDVGITHTCPTCGSVVPGSGQARCYPCSARATSARRIAIEQATLTQPWLADLFVSFCESGRIPLDQGKATARISSAAAFCRRLDTAFSNPNAITVETLHALTGAEGLRRVAPFIAYLTEIGVLTYDRARLDACIEEDRIARLLHSAETPHICLIRAYRDHLASRGRTLKTQRVAVTSALALMNRLGDAPLHELSQIHLRRTLHRRPGLAAALCGFLSLVAMHGGPDLTPVRPRRMDPVRDEKRIIAKVRNWRISLCSPRSEAHARALIAGLIAQIYAIPLTRVLTLRRTDVGPGPTLWPDEMAIRLAEPLSSAFTRWAASDGTFAFPGRHGHQPVSETAVRYQLSLSSKSSFTRSSKLPSSAALIPKTGSLTCLGGYLTIRPSDPIHQTWRRATPVGANQQDNRSRKNLRLTHFSCKCQD